VRYSRVSDQLTVAADKTVTDWATMVAAATSSPPERISTNRFACLGTTDDEQSDSLPFTEVQSRRVKRRRNISSPQQQQQQQQQQSQQQQSQSRGRRSARLLTVTRGSCLKLVKPTCSSDIRKYFFTSRVIDVWNFLNDGLLYSPHWLPVRHRIEFKTAILCASKQ